MRKGVPLLIHAQELLRMCHLSLKPFRRKACAVRFAESQSVIFCIATYRAFNFRNFIGPIKE